MLFAIWRFFHPKEYAEVLTLQSQVKTLLEQARREIPGELEYWKLAGKLNEITRKAGLNYAWGNQIFNPSLGVIYKVIGNQLLRVTIGLRIDRFTEPCAVFHIMDDYEYSLRR